MVVIDVLTEINIYLSKRIERLREEMLGKGLDAVIVSHPANRRYLSAFSAADPQPGETPGWLVIGRDKAFGLISSSSFAEVKQQAQHLEVMKVDAPIASKIASATATLLGKQNWRVIGFEQDALSYRWHSELASELKAGQELRPTTNLVEGLREIKDELELKHIEEACRITSQAFEQVMSSILPGITERELAWQLESTMRGMGSEGAAFEIIVAAGPGGAIPHHTPDDTPIQAHEPVIIDMGAKIAGYAADMTRTICLGEAPQLLKEQYSLVQEALSSAIERTAPGQRGEQVCSGPEEVMRASKFHKGYSGGIGHGIGLAVHEPPLLRSDNLVLKQSMVLAIEPAVYIDGWGGVRLEDTVVIADNGSRRLTTSPFRLEY